MQLYNIISFDFAPLFYMSDIHLLDIFSKTHQKTQFNLDSKMAYLSHLYSKIAYFKDKIKFLDEKEQLSLL